MAFKKHVSTARLVPPRCLVTCHMACPVVCQVILTMQSILCLLQCVEVCVQPTPVAVDVRQLLLLLTECPVERHRQTPEEHHTYESCDCLRPITSNEMPREHYGSETMWTVYLVTCINQLFTSPTIKACHEEEHLLASPPVDVT